MKKTRITTMALTIAAASVLLSGCSENEPEYNYDMLGGELISTSSDYDVDIRTDDNNAESTDSIDTESSNTNSTDANNTSSAPAAQPKPDALTEVTSKPNTAPQTENTTSDTTEKENTSSQSEVTSQPIAESVPESSDTSSQVENTQQPSDTQEFDENGFPANPQSGQLYQDESGQWWSYSAVMMGWGKTDPDAPAVITEVWDFELSGEQILF